MSCVELVSFVILCCAPVYSLNILLPPPLRTYVGFSCCPFPSDQRQRRPSSHQQNIVVTSPAQPPSWPTAASCLILFGSFSRSLETTRILAGNSGFFFPSLHLIIIYFLTLHKRGPHHPPPGHQQLLPLESILPFPKILRPARALALTCATPHRLSTHQLSKTRCEGAFLFNITAVQGGAVPRAPDRTLPRPPSPLPPPDLDFHPQTATQPTTLSSYSRLGPPRTP